MIVYPDANYNSWISEDDADTYFETRLDSEPWIAAGNKEAALITAFQSIDELYMLIDPVKADNLNALKQAQCEEALHELRYNINGLSISSLTFGGLLSVKVPENQLPTTRYSRRALAILRPFLIAPSKTRTR